MRHRAFRFFLCLAAVCVAALWVSPAFAAEGKDRYIKVVGVEGGVLNLDVDGKPVKIPLPEGYEVMQEKMFEKTYKGIVADESKVGGLILGIFADSEEVQKRKSGIHSDSFKIVYFVIPEWYVHERYTVNDFQKEKKIINDEEKDIREWANQELLKKGLSPFSYRKIYEEADSISFLHIENFASQREHRFVFTISFILIDNIIVECLMNKFLNNEKDIDLITNDTLDYIKKVNR